MKIQGEEVSVFSLFFWLIIDAILNCYFGWWSRIRIETFFYSDLFDFILYILWKLIFSLKNKISKISKNSFS